MGPIRYKVFGYHKYATTELYKKTTSYVMPFALIAGITGDVIIIAIDTPTVIVCGIPLVYTHGGIEGMKCKTAGDFTIMTLMFPFWYPLELYSLQLGSSEMYYEIFGNDTGIFTEPIKIKDTNEKQ
jgi:hypothetical protein